VNCWTLSLSNKRTALFFYLPSFSTERCWLWCEKWLPFGKKFHPWGIGAICWAIWKSRNKACFEKKLIKNPLEIICHACALMNFWSGLYAEMDQDQLVEGANTMLRVAKEVLGTRTRERGIRRFWKKLK